jgi:hypothetical protein
VVRPSDQCPFHCPSSCTLRLKNKRWQGWNIFYLKLKREQSLDIKKVEKGMS